MPAVREAAVVITGASSGIGRATALELAKSGAKLILAARDDAALQDVVKECEHAGGKAQAIAADVTKEAHVQKLLDEALRAYGRIDVWINNAGVLAYGLVEDTPSDTFRQVIETNLLGTFLGTQTVVPVFRRQKQGVLINVASELGKFGQPYSSAYVASKFGVVGFSESVREELIDLPDVHVCTVMPSATDTPIFQKAANYTGRAIQAPPPVDPPEAVAVAIRKCIEKPQREIIIGNGRRLNLMHALAPGFMERQVANQADQNFQNRFAAETDGNLYGSLSEQNQPYGGWRKNESHWGTLAGVGLVAAGLGLAYLLTTSGDDHA